MSSDRAPFVAVTRLDLRRIGFGIVIGALALFGTGYFSSVVDVSYPIRNWLFWPVARVWGATLLFNGAALVFGQLILVHVLRLRALPRLEGAVLATCLGVFAFAAAMFAAGIVGGFVPAFASALPIAMFACGAARSPRASPGPRPASPRPLQARCPSSWPAQG